jgi:hypothetical protein
MKKTIGIIVVAAVVLTVALTVAPGHLSGSEPSAKPTKIKLTKQYASRYLDAVQLHAPRNVQKWHRHLQRLRDAGHPVDESKTIVVVLRRAKPQVHNLVGALLNRARGLLSPTVHADEPGCDPEEYALGPAASLFQLFVPTVQAQEDPCGYEQTDSYGLYNFYDEYDGGGGGGGYLDVAEDYFDESVEGQQIETEDDLEIDIDSSLTWDDFDDPQAVASKTTATVSSATVTVEIAGFEVQALPKTWETYHCQNPAEMAAAASHIKGNAVIAAIGTGIVGFVVGDAATPIGGAILGLKTTIATFDVIAAGEIAWMTCVCYTNVCSSSRP